MLPRCHRLPSSEITRVIHHGKRVIGETIQVTAQKNEADVLPSLRGPRFAFIVSTKIDKRATRRNRMKRLLSESIFHLLPRLHGHVDCIVVARRNFSEMSQQEVEKSVVELFEKAHLVNHE